MGPTPIYFFRKFFKTLNSSIDGVASSGKVGWLYGRGMGQLFRAFDETSEGPWPAGLRGALGLRVG